jgi:formate/nitrite transporter
MIVAAAELFTGNNLLAMAWAARKISSSEVLKNWLVVCTANFVGASGLALLVFFSAHPDMNDGAIADRYIEIAAAKCSMPFWTAFSRGVLCNILVCMAVWMAFSGRSVFDKVVAIVFPISAFVAAGFEHSIANMYLIPMGILVKASGHVGVNADAIGWVGFMSNLVPVILGNLVGGSVLVGFVYYIIYLRSEPE